MDIVSSHWVDGIRLTVENILIVKEELISFHELLILCSQLIGIDFVFNNVSKFEIVVRDSLSTKHDHCILIDHMKSYKPDLLLSHYVDDLPWSSLWI